MSAMKLLKYDSVLSNFYFSSVFSLFSWLYSYYRSLDLSDFPLFFAIVSHFCFIDLSLSSNPLFSSLIPPSFCVNAVIWLYTFCVSLCMNLRVLSFSSSLFLCYFTRSVWCIPTYSLNLLSIELTFHLLNREDNLDFRSLSAIYLQFINAPYTLNSMSCSFLVELGLD